MACCLVALRLTSLRFSRWRKKVMAEHVRHNAHGNGEYECDDAYPVAYGQLAHTTVHTPKSPRGW
jgi:hypothetical protein